MQGLERALARDLKPSAGGAALPLSEPGRAGGGNGCTFSDVDLDPLLQHLSVVPFGPGSRIPWNDPAFSERMLREHRSQAPDRASPRFEIIDPQVAWVHQSVLGGNSGRILDLASGYRLRDLDFGQGFDAVLMLFDAFNTFETREDRSLLARARSAPGKSRSLALEVHSPDYVRGLGEEAPTGSAQTPGRFSDFLGLTLRESTWHSDLEATTERYFGFRDEGRPAVYAQSTKAYSDTELDSMLEESGFEGTARDASLSQEDDAEAEFLASSQRACHGENRDASEPILIRGAPA